MAAVFFFMRVSLAEGEKTEQTVIDEKRCFDREMSFIRFPQECLNPVIQFLCNFWLKVNKS